MDRATSRGSAAPLAGLPSCSVIPCDGLSPVGRHERALDDCTVCRAVGEADLGSGASFAAGGHRRLRLLVELCGRRDARDVSGARACAREHGTHRPAAYCRVALFRRGRSHPALKEHQKYLTDPTEGLEAAGGLTVRATDRGCTSLASQFIHHYRSLVSPSSPSTSLMSHTQHSHSHRKRVARIYLACILVLLAGANAFIFKFAFYSQDMWRNFIGLLFGDLVSSITFDRGGVAADRLVTLCAHRDELADARHPRADGHLPRVRAAVRLASCDRHVRATAVAFHRRKHLADQIEAHPASGDAAGQRWVTSRSA